MGPFHPLQTCLYLHALRHLFSLLNLKQIDESASTWVSPVLFLLIGSVGPGFGQTDGWVFIIKYWLSRFWSTVLNTPGSLTPFIMQFCEIRSERFAPNPKSELLDVRLIDTGKMWDLVLDPWWWLDWRNEIRFACISKNILLIAKVL